jgi:hypothetical protein
VDSHLEMNNSKWLINCPVDRGEFKVFHQKKKLEIILPRLLLRCRLDQSGAFVPTGPVEISAMEPSEVNASEPEVVTVEDLRA